MYAEIKIWMYYMRMEAHVPWGGIRIWWSSRPSAVRGAAEVDPARRLTAGRHPAEEDTKQGAVPNMMPVQGAGSGIGRKKRT